MKIKENIQFESLCIKAVTGNIKPDEERILDKYLSASEENRNEFKRIQALWNKSKITVMPELPNPETEWLQLNARIEDYERKNYSYQKPKHKFLFTFRPALSAALFIIFFLSLWFFWDLEIKKPDYELVSTGNKEHREINLADGSKVLLNSGSILQFPGSFDKKERKITLKGEAFFSVAKDGRPFIIFTDNAAVTVLGTKFNVRARGGKTEVYVKEGKVNLARQNLKKTSVVLSKGELSRIIENEVPAPPVKSDPDPQLGWMAGKLVFDRTPLPEITDELERFYDVRITLSGNSLSSYSLTGSFNSRNIEDVLKMICLALDLEYSKASESGDQSSKRAEYSINLKK
ncbi:MAG TPA: FecR domain-containing protein [Ignavibacteriaceae bacterium]|nr:FecR domain-containing protein [Ignavibacteriaceae bacterium]